jgi:hypothetical protein
VHKARISEHRRNKADERRAKLQHEKNETKVRRLQEVIENKIEYKSRLLL